MQSSNKTIAKNTILLYFRMLITMGISLYASRVILKALGVGDFGIYNIVGGIVVLFSFVNGALVGSTQRFLNYEIGRNDIEAQKRIFKSSLTIYIAFCLIVILVSETVGLWFLKNKLNIPIDRMPAAFYVFQFSILTFCFNIIRVPYNATVIAYERMSFYAYLSIIEVILKLAIVYLLLFTAIDKLISYSFLVMIVSVIVFGVYAFYCNKAFKISQFKIYYSKSDYAQLLGFSTWSLFGSLANLSVNQGINIIFNIFYGVTLNASLGITNQVKNAVNSFVMNFQMAFSPQIVKSFASGDMERFHKLILSTSKYSFFLMYLICVPFLLNAEYIIITWLETLPPYLVIFCKLSIIQLLIDSLSAPLGIAIHATGKIKQYQLYYSAMSIIVLPLAYLLTKFDYSPKLVYVVWLCISFLLYLWKMQFVTKRVQMEIKKYIIQVILRIFSVVTLSIPLILLLVKKLVLNDSLYLIVSTLISLVIALIFIATIGITKNEKRTIIDFIAQKFTSKQKLNKA